MTRAPGTAGQLPSPDVTPQLLPGGYRLQHLLASTHFSSVWAAAAPSSPLEELQGAGARLTCAEATGVQTRPEAAGPASATAAALSRTGCLAPALDAPERAVVIKAVDACRPTHAAIAANEAAALRRMAASAASAHPGSVTDLGCGPSSDCTGLGQPSAGGSDGLTGATAPPPFVRLLGTFTTSAFASAAAAALAARQPAPVGHHRPNGGGTPGPHLHVEDALPQPAPPPPSSSVAPEGRRWRCLVLERLGPSASDVLARWQRWRELREPGTSEQHRQPEPARRQPQAAGNGGSGRVGREQPTRALGTGAEEAVEGAPGRGRELDGEGGRQRRPRGLPPGAVRSFAAEALAALDLVHSSAGLVHCDIKPDNFALRPPTAPGCDGPTSQLQGPPPHCSGSSAGRGTAERPPSARSRPNWVLLDFGSACSLDQGPGSQGPAHLEAGSGPPGRSTRGRVRPCAPPPGGDTSSDGHDGGSETAAQPWYDTPSYAAPELALGLAPSPASDMWSLGCTVFELATGSKLLPVPPAVLRESHESRGGGGGAGWAGPDAAEAHLALVVQLLGRPPAGLLARAPRADWFFDSRSRRMLLEEEYEVPRPRPLERRLGEAWRGQAAAAGSAAGRRGSGCAGYLTDGAGGVGVDVADAGDVGAHLPVAVGIGAAGMTADGSASQRPGGGRAGEAGGGRREPGAVSLWDSRQEWTEALLRSGGGVWDEAEVSGLRSFLSPLLRWDPRDRPPAHVAAGHPWLAAAGRDGPC